MKNFRKGFTLVEIMIVVAIIGILICIAVPGFIRARSQSRMKSCQENLTKISLAKAQWATEHHAQPGTPITREQLIAEGFLSKNTLIEPSEGSYEIGNIGDDPTCSTGYPGHSLNEVGTVVTGVEG